MAERARLISDLHLDPSRPAVTAAFLAFLKQSEGQPAVYILGDLFEAWIGDDDDQPLATTVAGAIRDLAESGCEVFLMRGNRDFLLGTDFCERAGAKLLDDETVVNLGGEDTLLLHGDSLCTADADYQAFRAMTRDPAWQADILAKSLEERRALAQHLRSVSKDAGSNKPEDILDVTPDEVERLLVSRGVRRMIHGHTHRPGHHRHRAGNRWVLGDWEQSGWCIEVDTGGISLREFPIAQH
jgi:UDP-2,3-diacylglucosamine hydrolase